MVAKRSSGIRSAFRNSPEKGSSSNQDRSVQGQPTTTRYRRHEKFENPLQTWWCGGYLMSGGDNLWSFALALVVFLGITGVWIGTTGAWLWVHGAEYGLAKGGGVGIVVVFV
jgi:palmitoyltransferase ZDHHC9/14/18